MDSPYQSLNIPMVSTGAVDGCLMITIIDIRMPQNNDWRTHWSLNTIVSMTVALPLHLYASWHFIPRFIYSFTKESKGIQLYFGRSYF